MTRPAARFIRGMGLLSVCALLTTIAPTHPARAWEANGHVLIADVALRSLPAGPLRSFYTGSLTWFETNSSFPDRWRLRDNAEAPRHFLNMEAFGGRTATQIPADFKDVLALRTYDQLRTDGVLPWTVDRHFKLLVSAFRQKRWSDAMIESLYLSDYVGDAHAPFHTTANFDGQLSVPPQDGLGSRFEKEILFRSIKPSDLREGKAARIPDPKTAIFAAIADSAREVPGLLDADRTAATSVTDPNADRMYGDTYWASFLPRARPVAVSRLQQAGVLLAGILQEAWNEAGKPIPPAGFTASDALLPYTPPEPVTGQKQAPFPPPLDNSIVSAARSQAKTITLSSRRLGKDISVTVLLPRNYAPQTMRYPVLYVLHGSESNYREWNEKSGVAAYIQDIPLIVVLPDAGGDTWYVDSPNGGRYADFFYDELMPFIDKQYATINRREGRAIAGNSMGGYGAWYLALRRPRLFAATASLSGALHFGTGEIGVDENGEFAQQLFGDAADPAAKREYEAVQILPLIEKLQGHRRGQHASMAYNGPALYFNDGKDDYLNGANRQMEQSLLSLGVPYEYAEFDGSHDWNYWDLHIRDVLKFVRRHLAAPEPTKT